MTNVVDTATHPVEDQLEADFATVVAMVASGPLGPPNEARNSFRGYGHQGRIYAAWRDPIGQLTRLQIDREPTGDAWTVCASTQRPVPDVPVRVVRGTVMAPSFRLIEAAAELVGALDTHV